MLLRGRQTKSSHQQCERLCPRERCFGYFQSYERAREALGTNECDVWEMGIWGYAIIEKVEPGLHPHSEEMAWFEFDTEKRRFREIPKPEETNGEYNYALG